MWAKARPDLGGTWLSLAAVNMGSALVWASIFLLGWQGMLHGTAYAFYALSMIPVAMQLSRMMRNRSAEMEQGSRFHAAD